VSSTRGDPDKGFSCARRKSGSTNRDSSSLNDYTAKYSTITNVPKFSCPHSRQGSRKIGVLRALAISLLAGTAPYFAGINPAHSQVATVTCSEVSTDSNFNQTLTTKTVASVFLEVAVPGETITFMTSSTGGALGTVILIDAPFALPSPRPHIVPNPPPQSVSYTAPQAGTYEFIYLPSSIGSGSTITFSAGCASPSGSTNTGDVTRAFVARRLDQMITNEPDRNRYIRRLTGSTESQNSGLGFVGLNSTSTFTSLNFATSLKQINSALSKTSNRNVVNEKLGFADNSFKDISRQTNVDIWIEGRYSNFEDDVAGANRDGVFGVIYLGADYMVTPSILFGLLAQYDWADEESNMLSTDINGKGWMVGPYVSGRINQNIFFDVRAAWGQSDNKLNNNAITGSFDTDRWLIRGNLSGNWRQGSWRITPNASIVYAEEKQDNFVNSSGVAVPSQTINLGRVTFGPEIGYRASLSDGTIVEPHFSVQGLWDFESKGNLVIGGTLVDTDDFRAKLEGGIIVKMTNGFSIRAVGNYDGIGGDDFHAYGGQVWVNSPLN